MTRTSGATSMLTGCFRCPTRWVCGRSSASPLEWDVFAVSTYCDGFALVLVCRFDSRPGDAARPRRQTRWCKVFTRLACAGLARLAAQHWHRYMAVYLILAGISTPLVLSVHSTISFDFAVGHRSRLAHHDFPALLRGGRGFRRFRDGADSGDSAARILQPERPHHHEAPGKLAKVMLATGLSCSTAT